MKHMKTINDKLTELRMEIELWELNADMAREQNLLDNSFNLNQIQYQNILLQIKYD